MSKFASLAAVVCIIESDWQDMLDFLEEEGEELRDYAVDDGDAHLLQYCESGGLSADDVVELVHTPGPTDAGKVAGLLARKEANAEEAAAAEKVVKKKKKKKVSKDKK